MNGICLYLVSARHYIPPATSEHVDNINSEPDFEAAIAAAKELTSLFVGKKLDKLALKNRW